MGLDSNARPLKFCRGCKSLELEGKKESNYITFGCKLKRRKTGVVNSQ